MRGTGGREQGAAGEARASSRRRSPRPLHPALALLGASVLHAALLVSLMWSTPPRAFEPQPGDVIGIELSFTEETPTPPEPAPTEPPTPAAAPSPAEPPGAKQAKQVRASEPAVATAPPAGPPAEALESAPGGDGSVAGDAPPASDGEQPRAIDLGLNGGVARAAVLGGWLEPEPAPPPPSIGLLVEGLAQLDAERGLARSNAAVAAGYEAARRAAPNGIALFDLRTDERGVVLSISLASAASHEARWQRVGKELEEILKARRLRVPPGAKGLAVRLRIERGALAQTLAERDTMKRGVAIGQEEGHPRERRNISTRGHLEDPTKLAPSLGGAVSAGETALIRVIVVDEKAL